MERRTRWTWNMNMNTWENENPWCWETENREIEQLESLFLVPCFTSFMHSALCAQYKYLHNVITHIDTQYTIHSHNQEPTHNKSVFITHKLHSPYFLAVHSVQLKIKKAIHNVLSTWTKYTLRSHTIRKTMKISMIFFTYALDSRLSTLPASSLQPS